MLKYIKSTAKGLAWALIIAVGMCFVFSFTILKLNIGELLVKGVVLLTVSLCGYIASYIITQNYRNNGFLRGFLIGIGISAVILVSTLIISKSLTAFYISKAIAATVCAIIGGVVGVNTRKTK